ncbi:MAG: YifB family Mg chelatase-like AAA ATPase [Deltaproteobacteria bacterium]|nr:YifB family Mg chelatase-like AAA ATPase [Deltaproteobacteria bacterium]
MLATAHTMALVGLSPHPVRVEVHSGRGTASFDVVGLPEATVRESRVRVRAALGQIGVPLHSHALTVNLAPADLRKIGSVFDLAIALGTLAAVGGMDGLLLSDTLFLGELSLTGAIHPVRGVLPRLVGAAAHGFHRAVVPRANGAEAAIVARAEGLEVLVADDLASVVAFLRGEGALSAAEPSGTEVHDPVADLSDVRGQPSARQALEIAAAGGHDLLFVGPAGAGKTMLARRMPGLLPPLSDEEALVVTAIHSVAGALPEGHGLVRTRPFRWPHHSVSDAGLLGSGDPPRPGEVSLAHDGVLFLDELPEFRRSAIDGLRQPLEDGAIRITRAKSSATFPARPMLLAAMNPCPCGWNGFDGVRVCTCTTDRVRHYRARVSGPILDRIDLQLRVEPVHVAALVGPPGREECTSVVRRRVLAARAMQAERWARGETSASTNARLAPRDLERVAAPDATGRAVLEALLGQRGMSARAYGKVLRVARTLADLQGRTAITSQDLLQAADFRVLDRPIDAEAA